MKLNIVPARTGIQWVKLGALTFFRQPLALAGLFFMYTAVVVVLAQIPVIGVVIGGVLVPAATLGLMAATAEAQGGKFPMPWVLLSAFRAGKQRARAMLALGLMYTAGSLMATVIGSLLIGAPAPAAAGAQEPQLDVRTLFVLALHTPLVVLFWHAPALVHWHGIAPAKSLFFSAVACWRNLGAMLMFAVTWLAVFLAMGFVLSTIGLLAGGLDAARAVMMPVVLLMVAMFSTSLYFTFRDSFVADAADPPPPQPDTPPGASPP